jgi:3-oxoadipate enol-lactonase
MGGPIAQLVWQRHREAVAGLVLCATAARFSVNPQLVPAVGAFGLGLSIALSAVPDPVWRQMRARALRNRPIDDPRLIDWVLDEQRHSDAASLVQAGAALNGYDAWDWIHSIDVPTSVVITEADQTVSPSRQRRMAEAIPGARTFAVDGDHRVCVDAPARFVPALLDACRHAAGVAADATTGH